MHHHFSSFLLFYLIRWHYYSYFVLFHCFLFCSSTPFRKFDMLCFPRIIGSVLLLFVYYSKFVCYLFCVEDNMLQSYEIWPLFYPFCYV